MIARPLLALVGAGLLLPLGGSAYLKNERGNEQFLQGRYADAMRSYTEARIDRPEAPELDYNIGNVFYRRNDLKRAAQAYEQALESGAANVIGPASYNLGNVRFRQADVQAAVSAFEDALRADPDDLDAKRNLEIALLVIERMRPEEPEETESESPEEEKPQPEETEEEQEQPPEEPASLLR